MSAGNVESDFPGFWAMHPSPTHKSIQQFQSLWDQKICMTIT